MGALMDMDEERRGRFLELFNNLVEFYDRDKVLDSEIKIG